MRMATIAGLLAEIPTWGWFFLGWFALAILVSPFIAVCIHDVGDDDWP
jgi:hypothetical protein